MHSPHCVCALFSLLSVCALCVCGILCGTGLRVYPCPILLQKIQQLTNKPYGHMELPQVARYASSQRYVEHYDGVDPHTDAGRAFCASGGQRVAVRVWPSLRPPLHSTHRRPTHVPPQHTCPTVLSVWSAVSQIVVPS